MASNRWVAVDPDILNHPLVGAGQPVAPADPMRGAYSRMEAWLWIICNASFADHTVTNRGRKMTLQRGDLLGAYAFLGHTFNWSRRTVKAWIDKLVEDNMLSRRAIEQQEAHKVVGEAVADVEDAGFYGNQATILSVLNYWRFQFDKAPSEGGHQFEHQSGHQNEHQSVHQSAELSASKIADKYILPLQQGTPVETPTETPVGTPKRTHITIDNNYPSSSNNNPLSEASSDDDKIPKKLKRLRKPKVYSEAFEIFWTGYPDRTNNSKLKAFEEWERLEEPDQNAALASIPAFGAYCRKQKDYRCVHAERYLRDRRWESFVQQQGQTGQTPWWRDPEQLKRLSDDRWRKGIEELTQGKDEWPEDKLGPPPGRRGCVIPAHIVSELNLTEIYSPAGIKRQ